MNAKIAYSPKKDDLYGPCKNAQFFAAGTPTSDAALCVELSRLAYCRLDKLNFAFNRNKIIAELAHVGLTVDHFLESQQTPNGRGTHCFVAKRQDPQLTVVVFRGTDGDDPTDVWDDANARPVRWNSGGNVHCGFKDALADVLDDLTQALDPNPGRLVFTGHSLGAALATLLASLRKSGIIYTFGSPLVGDSDFVATLKDVRNYRYADCCDIVTRVPPYELGYRHVGKPYYIAQDRSVTFDPSDAFIRQDRFKAFLAYPFKYQAWRKDHVGWRELADHAPVNYVSAVSAANPPT